MSTKSAKISFYYTFCFVLTLIYFSSISYNISIAEDDFDENEGKKKKDDFEYFFHMAFFFII